MFDPWFANAPAALRTGVELVIENAVNRMVLVMNDPSRRAEDRTFELLSCAAQLRSVKIVVDALSHGINEGKGPDAAP